MKIGIPRALLYFNYYPFWKTFFEELNHETVLSSKTTNRVLDMGVKSCVDDACLPVKLFHGHVMDLIGKADRIFIPRLISVEPGEYICPKFIGLPEMVKNSVPNLPELIVIDFNAHRNAEREYDGCKAVGKALGAGLKQINGALEKAKSAQREYENRLLQGYNPLKLLDQGAAEAQRIPGKGSGKGRIALIGHPYLLYDQHINMNICSKLEKRGYQPLFPENIGKDSIDAACAGLPKKLFWSYGQRLLGSGLHMLERGMVSGIVFISSFGCGIDSFIGELLQRFNHRSFKVPYTTITLDEHSGQAGFDTRLEAFTDMLEWRRVDGCHIPSYGQNVHTCQSPF